MSKPNGITVSSSKRGTTIKARGAAAQALFDALTDKPSSTAVPQLFMTITFDDQGQDFLEWDLDRKGHVIACRPSQAWLWVGTRVTTQPELGKRVGIKTKTGERMFIKYDITRIKHAPPPSPP